MSWDNHDSFEKWYSVQPSWWSNEVQPICSLYPDNSSPRFLEDDWEQPFRLWNLEPDRHVLTKMPLYQIDFVSLAKLYCQQRWGKVRHSAFQAFPSYTLIHLSVILTIHSWRHILAVYMIPDITRVTTNFSVFSSNTHITNPHYGIQGQALSSKSQALSINTTKIYKVLISKSSVNL